MRFQSSTKRIVNDEAEVTLSLEAEVENKRASTVTRRDWRATRKLQNTVQA